MRIELNELYKSNYEVIYLDSIRQYWKKAQSFSCLNSPKKQELFLYLDGCDAEYEKTDGTKLFAKSGNLIYTAKGSQYKVTFYNFKNESSSTVGINFYLFNENHSPISLDKDIIVFNTDDEIVEAIGKAEAYAHSSVRNTRARFKSILFQIFSELGENSRYLSLNNEQGYALVSRAIHYINANVDSNISVTELAHMCKISEVYLRTLFRRFTGMSPTEYRTELRLKKAKNYLLYGDIPINEIAEILGFSSTAYFIKLFKRKYQCSPLSYRKQASI